MAEQNITTISELFDQLTRFASQAKAVTSSLISNDSFKDLSGDTVADILSLIEDRLGDIQEAITGFQITPVEQQGKGV